MKSPLIVVLAALLVVPLLLFGHGGGLDSYGGHNDRAAGNYHFHRGPLAGRTFASKADAIRALNAAQGSSKGVRNEEAKSQTVYITRTGKKYHGPYCSYLRSSRIPISLKDARQQGYTPCSRCGGR